MDESVFLPGGVFAVEEEILICRERGEECRAVEELVRESFWNVYRPGCLEHYALHRLRSCPEFVPSLSLLLYFRGGLAGQIAFVKNALTGGGGAQVPVLTLGPLCIRPSLQRQGLGKRLLDHALGEAAKTEAAGVFLEGNPEFYGKSGFVEASSLGIDYMDEPPGASVPYFLVHPLDKARLQGIQAPYRVPKGYLVDEGEAEEFDRTFPPREKLRLPGQLF